MFTIQNFQKIQHYYKNDEWLTSAFVPENTLKEGGYLAKEFGWNQSESKQHVAHVSQRTQYILTEPKKDSEETLWGNIYDLRQPPIFKSAGDIETFYASLEQEIYKQTFNIDDTYKAQLTKDLCWSYRKAIEYLSHEGYSNLTGDNKSPDSMKDLFDIYKNIINRKRVQDKVKFCVLLKIMIGISMLARYNKFHIDGDVLEIGNKEFIEGIVRRFGGEEFRYESEQQKPSLESPQGTGSILLDGKKVHFDLTFGVKSLYSLVDKMASQEKYNAPQAFRDIHRMRIEVKDDKDALRIAKFCFGAFGNDLKIENIGGLIEEKEIGNYIDSRKSIEEEGPFIGALNIATKLQYAKKSYSAKRQELRLSRSGKYGNNQPIEIQIVLKNNTNEIGEGDHRIYEMQRKITARVRLVGWISKKNIENIIERVSQQQTSTPLPFSREQIYEKIIEKENFLIPLTDITKGKQREITHFSTLNVLEIFQQNYLKGEKTSTIGLVVPSLKGGIIRLDSFIFGES